MTSTEIVDIHIDTRLDEIKDQIDRLESKQDQIVEALAKKKGGKFFYAEDENKERGNWSGKLDFVISSIGYAVGLGNVWRFPYLCYKNGGGAFLVPYCIFLFLVGIPLFLVELSIGQFTSLGPARMWGLAPIFRGIGVGMIAVSGLVSIYYNVIIAWAFWYLFASFRAVLPWSTCGDWSSALCETKLQKLTEANCTSAYGYKPYPNGTCYTNSGTPVLVGLYNATLAAANNIKPKTPANDYLDYVGLQRGLSPGLHSIGPVRWDMALTLLLAWIVMWLCLSKGIKTSGKVVYFTALFPYVILIILFVNGLLQPGHEDGIKFYITPDPSRLLDATVWKDAAVQIFFSLGVCWGGLATMASYNRFHTNAVRDTFIISLVNCGTSIFAGFVIFSYLGAFAKSRGVAVADVVDSGVSLAFIVYPQAVTTLPVPTLWAILFFFMLVLLGMDSQFAMIETLITGICDSFPRLRKRKTLVGLAVSATGFLLGLTMATPGAAYVLTLMDDYSSGWNLMVLVLLECLALAIYGYKRFARDIETMIGKTVFWVIPWRVFQWYFIICWCFCSPLLVAATMVFSWVKYSPSKYGTYIFPTWANVVGWLLTFFVLCGVFGTMLYEVIKAPGNFREKCNALIRPTVEWGPALVKHRKLITYVPGFVINPWDVESINGVEVDVKKPGYPSYPKQTTGYDNTVYAQENTAM